MIRTVSRQVALDRPISTRLRWTAAYFRWCAVLSAIILVVNIIATAAGYAPWQLLFRTHPVVFVGSMSIALLTTAGWWFTGQTLRERRRIGGWLALATMLPPIAQAARNGEFGAGLTVPVLGTVALLSCWRELE